MNNKPAGFGKLWIKVFVIAVVLLLIGCVFVYKKHTATVEPLPKAVLTAPVDTASSAKQPVVSAKTVAANSSQVAANPDSAQKNAAVPVKEKPPVAKPVDNIPAAVVTPPSANPSTPAPAPVPKKMLRLVDLGARTCIPCKQMAPILAELKQEYAGRVSVEFIDVSEYSYAAYSYSIRTIPTQIFFDADGNEVFRHEGFISKADLVAVFQEYGAQ